MLPYLLHNCSLFTHGPLVRYVKLCTPGMPGTFFKPQRMRKPQFCASGKRSIPFIFTSMFLFDITRLSRLFVCLDNFYITGSYHSGSMPGSLILVVSLGHQQPWFWKCAIGKSLITTRKDFKAMCHFKALTSNQKYKIIFFSRDQPICLGLRVLIQP